MKILYCLAFKRQQFHIREIIQNYFAYCAITITNERERTASLGELLEKIGFHRAHYTCVNI